MAALELTDYKERDECVSLVVQPLNGNFGALVESRLNIKNVLASRGLSSELVNAWYSHRGLLVLRGFHDITPEQLLSISRLFGIVEHLDDSKVQYQVRPGVPVMRIGNTRDESGNLTALFTRDDPLPADGSCQYNSESRRPLWHTDSIYRRQAPIGSALYCRQAPPAGASTCFADMRGAYEALNDDVKTRLHSLECVCSLAHHDAKVHKHSPEYPTLTEAHRASHPPVRVPVVLQHPFTGQSALYGMNSSTCAIVPKGMHIDSTQMDEFELHAVEDSSVSQWRDLLPFVTSKRFTVTWQWEVGDLVIWDNRCTMHCATGFDHEKYTREMWRTTFSAHGSKKDSLMSKL